METSHFDDRRGNESKIIKELSKENQRLNEANKAMHEALENHSQQVSHLERKLKKERNSKKELADQITHLEHRLCKVEGGSNIPSISKVTGQL